MADRLEVRPYSLANGMYDVGEHYAIKMAGRVRGIDLHLNLDQADRIGELLQEAYRLGLDEGRGLNG